MSESDSGWTRIPRGQVRRGDRVKVTWGVKSLRFAAVGTVEEKPHRMDPADDQVRLKVAAGDRALVITSETGARVTDVEAGFLWDGWLFVTNDLKFFRPAD